MDIWMIFEIVVNTIEISAITFLFSRQLGVIKQKRKWVVLGVIFVVAIISLINMLNIHMQFEVLTGIYLYPMKFITASLMFAFACLVFSGSISEKIVWSLVSPFVMTISDFIALEIMRRATGRRIEEITQFGDLRVAVALIYIAVSCAIYLLLVFITRRRIKAAFHLPIWLRLLIVTILALGTITVDQLIDLNYEFDTISPHALNNKTIFITISFFVIIFGAFILIQQIGKLTQAVLQEQHDKMSSENYLELERAYSALRTERHDIRNHLKVMQGLLEVGEHEALSQYYEEIMGKYHSADSIYTMNIPINVVLANKFNLALANGIEIQHNIRNLRNLTDKYTDLCSLIANLLDNAIEACFRLPENSERYIDFELVGKSEMLIINVENSSDGNYKTSGDIFITRKAGLIHGSGLKIVRNTVNQYGGYVDIKSSPHNFKVSIMLPVNSFIKTDMED